MDETSKHPAKADEQPNSSGLVSGVATDRLLVDESYSDLSSILVRLYCFASTILQFGTERDMSSEHNGRTIATAQKIATPSTRSDIFQCFYFCLFIIV